MIIDLAESYYAGSFTQLIPCYVFGVCSIRVF